MAEMGVEEALQVTEGFEGIDLLVDDYVAKCVCALRSELNSPYQQLLRLLEEKPWRYIIDEWRGSPGGPHVVIQVWPGKVRREDCIETSGDTLDEASQKMLNTLKEHVIGGKA